MDFRKTYDQPLYSVQPVSAAGSITHLDSLISQARQRKKEHQQPRSKKKVKDYFKTLTKAAESANQILDQTHIPHRFCIYQKGSSVFIDFVTLDRTGKIIEILTKEITDDNFDQWIDDVSGIAGLLIDTTG